MVAMIRNARPDDLVLLQRIEIAAGAAFRGLGMNAVADDDPPGIAELGLDRWPRVVMFRALGS